MSSYTLGYRQVRGPEKRRDKRLPLPIFTIRLNRRLCSTVNWSLGGLLISDFTGDLTADETVKVAIKAADDKSDFSMHVQARVIRHDPAKREVALKFEKMDSQIYDFFEHCFSRRFKRDS